MSQWVGTESSSTLWPQQIKRCQFKNLLHFFQIHSTLYKAKSCYSLQLTLVFKYYMLQMRIQYNNQSWQIYFQRGDRCSGKHTIHCKCKVGLLLDVSILTPWGLKKKRQWAALSLTNEQITPVLKWELKKAPLPSNSQGNNEVLLTLKVLIHPHPFTPSMDVFFIFSCHRPVTKKNKKQKKSNPSNQTSCDRSFSRKEVKKCEFLASKSFRCVFLAFVRSLPVCER